MDKIKQFTIQKYSISKYKSDSRFLLMTLNVCCSNKIANDSIFTDEAIEEARETFINMPIVAKIKKNYSENNDDFQGHELELKLDKNGNKYYFYIEKPIGLVPESSNIKVVEDEIDSKQKWLVVEALIWAERDYEAAKIIKRRKSLGISMEVSFNDYKTIDGIDTVKKFTGLAITLLGENKIPAFKTSIAKLNENFSQFKEAMCFALNNSDGKQGGENKNMFYGLTTNQLREKLHNTLRQYKYEENEYEYQKYWLMDFDDVYIYVEDYEDGKDYRIQYSYKDNEVIINIESKEEIEEIYQTVNKFTNKTEVFLSKEDWGTGNEITIDKSKEALSNSSWGSVNKTSLRNNILKAKNYKSLVKDVYAKVEDGWEDAPSKYLKYPIMEIKEDKVVYNSGGLKSAQGYAEANNEVAIVKKVKSIRKKLGLIDDKKEGEKMINKIKVKEAFNSIKDFEYFGCGEKAVYAFKDGQIYAIPYEIVDDTVKMTSENAIVCGMYAYYTVEKLAEEEKVEGVAAKIDTENLPKEKEVVEEFFCDDKMAEKYSSIISEYENKLTRLNSEKEEMCNKFNEINTKFEDINTKFEDVNSKYNEMCNKYEKSEKDLKQYKIKDFENNVKSTLSEFELKDEFRKEWITKSKEYSDIELFKKDLVFAIYSINGNVKKTDNTIIKYGINNKTNNNSVSGEDVSPADKMRELFKIDK